MTKRKKLPQATDWRARDLADWNSHTFRAYISDKHAELYGIAYVTRNYGMEARLIKSMIDAHGTDVTKRFIDECFREYRPTPQYPGINFAFMYSYKRERILPRILAEVKREQQRQQAAERRMSAEEIAEWL